MAIEEEGDHAWILEVLLPGGSQLPAPFIVFVADRETNPVTKCTYGRQSWEAEFGRWIGEQKGRVPAVIKFADTTLKVIVLLILIRDKSHNGW